MFQINKTLGSCRSTLKKSSMLLYLLHDSTAGGTHDSVLWDPSKKRKETTERVRERRKNTEIKPKGKQTLWADMMKHSLLCGKAAKMIYTSILHTEIKENGVEMPIQFWMERALKHGTAKEYFD